MSDVEAYGLSEVQSVSLGQANLSIASSGLSSCSLVALGKVGIGPGISSVLIISSTKIRIFFDVQMTNNSALLNLDNYSIVSTGTGVSVYKVSITAENVTYPTYVDITISEMTGSQAYQVEVSDDSNGPIDRYGGNIDPSKNSEAFIGVGTNPEIKYVEALSETSVKVVFTEAMEDNLVIRDETKYSFDNGLSVVAVSSFSVDSVVLQTSEQTPGLLYTLTITN